MIQFGKQPLLVIFAMVAAVAMYVPMLHAAWLEMWPVARSFLYHGTFFLLVTFMIALAVDGRIRRRSPDVPLFEVLLAYLLLPALLGAPLAHLSPSAGLLDAYFEMLSCLTTTGMTQFGEPGALAEPLHLWRSLVGWLGGFFIVVVAFAVFAPLRIGGFEMQAVAQGSTETSGQIGYANISESIARRARQIAPIYVGITLCLTVMLTFVGDRNFVALTHAMSVISTSGVSPVGGIKNSGSGFLGEVLVFLFLIFAVSRHCLTFDRTFRNWIDFKRDKEANLALFFVVVISILIGVRVLVVSIDSGGRPDPDAMFRLLWGSAFTVLSFLTTTGFESSFWESDLQRLTPETGRLLLMGLAAAGGGVATTAGGIKLLRIYAVYKQGRRELTRLGYPNSVGGAGDRARMLRRQGAYVAWILLMLFVIALAFSILALSATGIEFERSFVLAVAGLSNTGPLATLAGFETTGFVDLTNSAKIILCLVMIVGRLEVLAVFSLLGHRYWRK
ncbi:MAG: hypothetical protein OXF88_10335 [Rhodobacteraceae bacterium]|nr:hypothetical protein [Paracoccaceae bacterium]MCY4137783.1 hypothetical protein [Paracoccaceae bacterium]